MKCSVGHYRGFDWKRQRICDVMALPYRTCSYFLYENDKPTGDHFKTQREMFEHINQITSRPVP